MDFYLARLPVFKALPPRELENLGRIFQLQRFTRKEAVFEEGGTPEAVFLLRSGLVKAVKHSPSDEVLAMEVVVPGQLFGMIAALDKKPYPVSALCLRDCEVYRVRTPEFDRLMTGFGDFARGVYSEVGRHLRHAQAARALAKEPAAKRIAYMLLRLWEALGKDLAVRREDIAELTGCTQGTVIRTLADFRKRRLISSGWKRLSLLSPERLKAAAGWGDF
ncbi:MAG: Crp/Fnr family transcriptional regulator [Elusimicrobiota bacterium]